MYRKGSLSTPKFWHIGFLHTLSWMPAAVGGTRAPQASAPSVSGDDFSSAIKNAPSVTLGRIVGHGGFLNRLLKRTAKAIHRGFFGATLITCQLTRFRQMTTRIHTSL